MNKTQARQLRKILEKVTVNMTDQEALEVATFVPRWKSGVDYIVDDRVSVEEGDTVLLYKCIQAHTSQDNWKPGIDTASIWTKIDVEHAGTIDDPIPYSVNMEIFNGKYYTQYDVLYLCTRNSQQPLFDNLADLMNIYVQVV